MNKKTALNTLWLIPVAIFLTLSLKHINAQADSSQMNNFAYPPPPTSPPPNPPPGGSGLSPTLPPSQTASSEAAQRALEHITNRDSLPIESLTILDDHATEYPSLGRRFQVVTLLDTRPQGKIYKLLVDLSDGRIEEDISALLNAETQAYQAKYGKLHITLYNRLQEISENDTLPVSIWISPQLGQTASSLQQTIFTALAAKYPEARGAMERSGKPMDVDSPELAAQIEADYISMLNSETGTRVEPLVQELRQRGFTVITQDGMPSITVILPKSVILELSYRDDISCIYLVEESPHPGLDSAVPTTLSPLVWGRGYDGSGVTIGILEHGNVDPANSFLHHAATSRAGGLGVQEHTTWVASDAASFHDTYRGIAPGAIILSAGHNAPPGDFVLALQWAFDQGAQVVNVSEGYESDNIMNWTDKAFDYWARTRFRFIAVLSHNTGGIILSPGKAWNVLTVGAVDDNNDAIWFGDTMWASSAYINPESDHSDREKPEVVAVGANIVALGVNDVPSLPTSGTSHAAPQVAGLAALLIDRNSSLTSWPEASRAIIMASATHNIEGPRTIIKGQGDLKDGAGAINADLADTTAQTRMLTTGPCNSSCWWGISINNTDFPVGSDLVRTFHVDDTTILVRLAIAWWANADTPANNYSFSRLDTDLDLLVFDLVGQVVATSASYDNNYEMVEFPAWQPGDYQIVVHKYRADEPSNYLGIALVMIPLPYRVNLPLVMKD